MSCIDGGLKYSLSPMAIVFSVLCIVLAFLVQLSVVLRLFWDVEGETASFSLFLPFCTVCESQTSVCEFEVKFETTSFNV